MKKIFAVSLLLSVWASPLWAHDDSMADFNASGSVLTLYDVCDRSMITTETGDEVEQIYCGLYVQTFTSGNDTIKGYPLDDLIYGGAGDDTILTGNGNDTVYAGSGNDTINVGAIDTWGLNYLYGEAGNDVIYGGIARDYINGGAGDDVINGFGYFNYLEGGEGSDTIYGGAEIDEIWGSDFEDFGSKETFQFNAENGAIEHNFYYNSALEYNVTDMIDAHSDNNIIYGGNNIRKKPIDTDFNGYAFNGHLFGNIIFGGDNNDRIYGGSGEDYIDTGNGMDLVYAGNGNDVINSLRATPVSEAKRVFGGNGGDTIFGGLHEDQLHGGNDNDELHGGAGGDFLSGDGGNDTLHGEAGDDALYGGEGGDYLRGGEGDDNLYPGQGEDGVYGDAGADTFYIEHTDTADYMGDFSIAEGDIINLSAVIEYTAATGKISDFVRIIDDSANAGVDLEVNPTGTGEWIKIADINGKDLLGDTLENLISSGTIIVE